MPRIQAGLKSLLPWAAAAIILLPVACGAGATPAGQPQLAPGQDTPRPTLNPTVTPSPTSVEEPDTMDLPPGSESLVARAKEELTQRLALASTDEIRVASVQSIEWRDASLGCPLEGFMYAQVITPGFQIILEAKGLQYDYHTDLNQQVIFCEAN